MARTSPLDTEIRSRIETFLAEISTMVRESAFQAVREALGGDGNGAAPARRGPGRPRGSGAQTGTSGSTTKKAGRRASRGGKRSSEEMDAMTELIELHIRQNPGQGAEQIGKAVGLSTKDMALPIRRLLAARTIRTEGQRRGTKYFAGGRGGGGRKAKAQRKSKGTRKASRKGARKKGRRGASSPASESSAALAA